MFGLGPLELVVIGAIAVMLYGKRLPEVGRSFGASLGELRRQWATLAQELDVAGHLENRAPIRRGPAAGGRASGARAEGNDGDDGGDDGAEVPAVASPRFDPPASE